jgi:CheY-like chemotaxis protein
LPSASGETCAEAHGVRLATEISRAAGIDACWLVVRGLMGNATARRILVIDDEAAIRTALRETLGDAGYAVAEACDGVEGVETLRSEPADAVVMDIYMPHQDGFETIRALRRVAPNVRIIAISGGSRGDFDPLKAAELLGADRALRKPFGIGDVLTALSEVLPSRFPPRQA